MVKGVSRHRSVSALLVDVPAGHAALLQRTLEDAGWNVRALPVQGAEALSAALQRRGWQAVLYGGDGPQAVPSRKALALVRLADPHLPFIAVSAHHRPGDLSALLRGLPGGVPTVSEVSKLPGGAHPRARAGADAPARRRRAPAAGRPAGDRRPPRRRPGADRAVRPRAGHARRVAGLHRRRRSGVRTAPCCAASPPGTRRARAPPVAALANATREQTFAAGQGLPGRVWAFRRPVWVAELSGQAVRAGLVSGAAFPIALGDECIGVIELYASDAREPNAEVSAMFATVGGQLAAYLARRRKRARARRAFDGAEALVVALDADGRVEIANGTACVALGVAEDELLGRDWFARVVTGARRGVRRSWPARASTLPGHAGRELALVALARRRRRADRRARLGRAVRAAAPRAGGRQRMASLAACAVVALPPRSPPPSSRAAARTSRTPPRRATTRSRELVITRRRRRRGRRPGARAEARPARSRPTARRAAPPPACPRATSRRRPPTPPARRSSAARRRRRSRARSAASPSTRRSRAATAARSSAGSASRRCWPRCVELPGHGPPRAEGRRTSAARSLDEAIEIAKRHVRGSRRRDAVEAIGRRYEAGGPGRDRASSSRARAGAAGLDVRGDGGVIAWTGRVFRTALDGDDPYEALRSQVERRPVAAQPGRVRAPVAASATRAAARSAASGPSPRGGRPRARRRSRGSPAARAAAAS